MQSLRSLACVVAVALLATACATSPSHDAPAADPTPITAQQAAAIAATPLASTSAAPPSANGSALPAIDPTLIKQGWRVVRRKDQLVYCRSEMVTGTQFRRKVCLTPDEIERQAQKAKEMRDRMIESRPGPPCTPMPGCAG